MPCAPTAPDQTSGALPKPWINRAIELLARDQPVSYAMVNELTCLRGLAEVHSWADRLTIDLEHLPFDTGWTARFHGTAGCRRPVHDRPLHSIRRGHPAHGRILCRRRERQPLHDPTGLGRRCPRPAAVPPNARRRSGPSWRAHATPSGLPTSARDRVRAGAVPAASTRRRQDLPCRARDRVCRVGAGRHGNVARTRGCPRPALAGRHARRAEIDEGVGIGAAEVAAIRRRQAAQNTVRTGSSRQTGPATPAE